jgi:hypothetical protein
MAIGNWWSSLDPDTQQALLLAGAGAAEGYFNNRAENNREDDRRRDSAITNQAEGIQSVMNSEAADYQFGANRNDSNATNAARMAGSSPLQFQGDRASMSALRDILGGAGRTTFAGMPSRYGKHMPQMGSTPFSAQTMNFMAPGAMAAAEKPYWEAQNNIDPRLPAPDLGAMGYGEAGAGVTAGLNTSRDARLKEREKEETADEDQSAKRRAALMAALTQLGPEGEKEKKSGGGSGWKTAAGIGAGLLGGYFFG